jgi:transcription-repair coupling factor (superfamily II helicase)
MEITKNKSTNELGIKKTIIKNIPNRKTMEDFFELNIGDAVVHENHGIGIYEGIVRMTVGEYTKDYLKIRYAGSDYLYVQTTQLDLVRKYIGQQETVKPNKLGGNEWQKTKSRVREDIKKIAFDLVELYSKRKEAKGFKFICNTECIKKFEKAFKYQETKDQLAAVKDIKSDMESGIVMDRLICGDVGYGKTEVAMRAAYIAVQNYKQVIYLVPTTILAQQHYNTFLERFDGFNVRTEVISRFKTDSQQKKIIAKLKSGEIDVIIGTHRLLSDNIIFKDLGLIVIDEEQRFGVSHKEKLKRVKENVNVLTLSATPIPRTLNMSLNGMRDVSLLTEPPLERRPIKTFVFEYDQNKIKCVIEKELARQGQVYYLYNKIENIDHVTKQLSLLVPNAVIRYAHGRLSELELEHIMSEFINGKVDVLVCTTIIETGMDISNVNTIIINDADNMGLAQLYQLRGRVGRSNKLGYAYLTYDSHKVLNATAKKRLDTICKFIEFGAGFKIAIKDLEIRGAGNLLGAEQHGNIANVGYDLYCKLLYEEMDRINKSQSNSVTNNTFESQKMFRQYNKTMVDININSYIPDKYIRDEAKRMEVYKNISLICDEDDYMLMINNLLDEFGEIPQCVMNLLHIALLKAIASKLKISTITHKHNNLVITMDVDSKVSMEKLVEVIKSNNKLFFTAGIKPCVTYKNLSSREIPYIIQILKSIAE